MQFTKDEVLSAINDIAMNIENPVNDVEAEQVYEFYLDNYGNEQLNFITMEEAVLESIYAIKGE